MALALVPVDNGLLVVRRNKKADPGFGQLALPGGYVDFREAWQDAAARELREETGIRLAPEGRIALDPDEEWLITLFCLHRI